MSAELLDRCADLLDQAEGILITAGAGMGVDSGLPDFRGTAGFWKAYPALGKARIHFEDIASPDSFESDPRLAWGFYGHRLTLYRRAEPHDGYRILLKWAKEMPRGAFVFTSNVDGHFHKAGFRADRICEVHGSIHHLQCMNGCWSEIWSASGFHPEVDEEQCRLASDLPRCPHCGEVARPNILMFGDSGWIDDRQRVQMAAMRQWLQGIQRLLVIELGAGTHIPTVRRMGESLDAPLIRINPTEPTIGSGRGVSMQLGAAEALLGIESKLGGT
jgi:NAD-dependent SIR2 family protein deacetylase